jgi:hypothetical protein
VRGFQVLSEAVLVGGPSGLEGTTLVRFNSTRRDRSRVADRLVFFAPIASVQISLCGRNRGCTRSEWWTTCYRLAPGWDSTFPGLPVALEC